MIETVLLVIIFARIRGIRISDIFRSWELYPVFVCAIAYVVLQIGIFSGHYNFIIFANIYRVVYSAAVFFLIYRFKIYKPSYIAIGFMFLGMILNQVVMHANKGKMPVFPTLTLKTGYITPDKISSIDGIHVLGDSATKLKFLSDIIDIGYCIMSVGDIMVRVFLFIVLFYSFKAIKKQGVSKITTPVS